MPDIQQMMKLLSYSQIKGIFSKLYGKDKIIIQNQIERYRHVIDRYQKFFNNGDIHLFSTPGRTELGGNHTDHNHGIVLAASVNLDSIAAAAKSTDDIITIYSEAYPNPFIVPLTQLNPTKEEEGTTTALIRGIAARFKQLGNHIGGFNAYLSSNVAIGSGLSSSASIEVLVGTIMNTFYNQKKIPHETLAQICQYAENVYFNKPCGLMDQMTCAVGGIVSIDFKVPEKPILKKVHFDFSSQDYSLLVVNAGGSHADLTDDYASIPQEMIAVAQALGKNVGRDVSLENVIANIKSLRIKVGDRPILRILHFLADNQRVLEQVEALEKNDFAKFLWLVNDSGNSSCKWLQNCYTIKNPFEQSINIALALTENYLRKTNHGACRVHGGGFAGTIQVFLPNNCLDEYIKLMQDAFGEQSVFVLRIRPVGTVHINSWL